MQQKNSAAVIGMFGSIQALRVLAAFLVVFMHSIFFLYGEAGARSMAEPMLWNALHLNVIGGAGVHIFFTISGFVIAIQALQSGGRGALEFFARRIVRIVPLYWILTLFVWLTSAKGSVPDAVLIKSLLFIPVDSYFPLLGVGWTLNYEMYFYLLYALLVAWLGLKRCWLALAMAGVVLINITSAGKYATVLGNPIVIEFCAGMAAAFLYKNGYVARFAKAIALIGLLGMASTALWFVPDTVWALNAVIYWGVPSFFLVLGVVAMEKSGAGFLNGKVIYFLADISYAFYLVHVIAFRWLVPAAIEHIVIPTGARLDLAIPVLIVTCLLLAALLHIVIERPLGKAGKSLIKQVKTRYLRAPSNVAPSYPLASKKVS
ncbi:acyltransferase [Chitinimonas sp.]|uniref:acyltransferase family protein n=1 Tax=Chitinimonas sp. TaxID=1934313 RepID=UPI002F94C029